MRRLPALFVVALVALPLARTDACVLPPPARVRIANPIDGETAVPTSIRPRVAYGTGPFADPKCGAAPPPPVIRPAAVDGGAAPADGGAAIAGSWVKTTDHDPHNGVEWEFRPASPLAPRTAYELVDTYPQSCDCSRGPCVATPEAVFVRFTTGDGPDVTPPTFSGVAGSYCAHDICGAQDDTCCGPYNHLRLGFVAANDARDDYLVGTRLYVRADNAAWDFTHPVGGPAISDPADAPVAPVWDITLVPGKYHVIARAYDSSGNEDGNMAEVVFTWPLASDDRCKVILVDAGPPPPDMAWTPPVQDFSGQFIDMSAAVTGGTCTSCAIGGRRRGAPAGAWIVGALAAAAFTVRRGRRRSRRAGAGAAP